MKQLISSWQTLFSVLFIISVALFLLCLCAKYLCKYCRRIGRQRNSGTEEVILPLQYSSETTTVLHKCASDSILPPSLIPTTTTSEDERGEQRREEEEEVLLAENNLCFQDLPSDVLLRIISFLPLASTGPLVRVCKSWSDVLRDPQNMDLLLGRKHLGRPNHNPMYLYKESNYERGTTDLYLLDSMRISNYHFSKLPVETQMRMAGSCSGFICCAFRCPLTHLTLCNPLTQEFVKLPELPPKASASYSVFGLGIDLTRSKPSKLVRILCNEGETCVLECNVYTFGSTCWRSVEAPKFQPCSQGVLYNWTLYWMVCESSYLLVRPILTFDLENEKFGLFSPPPHRSEGQEPRLSYMMNLGNELSYVNEYEGEIGIHVLEDDAKMVWSLRYRISNRKMTLRGVWANDALLVEHSRGIYYYDPNGMKFQQICVPRVGRRHTYLSDFVIQQFFPNLVSPKIFWS